MIKVIKNCTICSEEIPFNLNEIKDFAKNIQEYKAHPLGQIDTIEKFIDAFDQQDVICEECSTNSYKESANDLNREYWKEYLRHNSGEW